MKRHLTIFLIAFAVLGMTARGFCYQAEVTDISGNKYFPAVKEALSKAEQSVYVVMFTIEPGEDSKPGKLIEALIAAKNRGVAVEVILDQPSTRLVPKNALVYKRLKDAGIKVYYDQAGKTTHAKAVVIDKRIVILGSTNWTSSSFDRNIETSVLIDSPELADEILTYLKTIKIDEKIDDYLASIGSSVPISREFMENPRLAPLLVKDQAERAFDVYLYLLWKREFNNKQALFYDDLAKYLGIYDGRTATDYRRQIIKVFRKLERKYKLLKFEPRYAKEAMITLLVYAQPGEQTFGLPADYFNLGWNRELSLRAKFCYLINLAYTDVSNMKPYWSKSVDTIVRQSGAIGQDVIHKGMAELRRKKLLEVKYDELTGKAYDERRPKMYKISKLYDLKELELKLQAIEEKYGTKEYTQARKYAEIVFEENNPAVIEEIILKTQEYGAKEIKRAFGEIARKNIDNPKRNYLYLTRILGKTE